MEAPLAASVKGSRAGEGDPNGEVCTQEPLSFPRLLPRPSRDVRVRPDVWSQGSRET